MRHPAYGPRVIEVGTRGHWGHVPPKDFAINKEVQFLWQKMPPFSYGKMSLKCRAPKFEMLPMPVPCVYY